MESRRDDICRRGKVSYLTDLLHDLDIRRRSYGVFVMTEIHFNLGRAVNLFYTARQRCIQSGYKILILLAFAP